MDSRKISEQFIEDNKDELTENIMELMKNYIKNNPTEISEPDFHDNMIDNVKEILERIKAHTLNTTDIVLHNSTGNDAKYDVFNYYSASNWLAIFPDLGNGGDVSGGYGGWTWLQSNPWGSTTLVTAMNNGQWTGTNSPTGLTKYNGSYWSSQGGFQFYGVNYTGNGGYRVRWGWAWNNEGDQGSNDVSGGIGMDQRSYSAGDVINCCQVNSGVNRSMRFMWFVK